MAKKNAKNVEENNAIVINRTVGVSYTSHTDVKAFLTASAQRKVANTLSTYAKEELGINVFVMSSEKAVQPQFIYTPHPNISPVCVRLEIEKDEEFMQSVEESLANVDTELHDDLREVRIEREVKRRVSEQEIELVEQLAKDKLTFVTFERDVTKAWTTLLTAFIGRAATRHLAAMLQKSANAQEDLTVTMEKAATYAHAISAANRVLAKDTKETRYTRVLLNSIKR